MYNSDSHQQLQVETNESKPLNLKFGYPDHIKEGLSSAINFVLIKLDFVPILPIRPTDLSIEDRLEAVNADGKQVNIYIHRIDGTEFENIIVYTNDCLRDYHHYSMLGVEFTSRPIYCSRGLKVDFYGNNDNLYTLLEERDYMNG